MAVMTEHVEHGFGPVWDAESRVLVLGSMPSPKSREASFYYMHPRNRFWPVMAAALTAAVLSAVAEVLFLFLPTLLPVFPLMQPLPPTNYLPAAELLWQPGVSSVQD